MKKRAVTLICALVCVLLLGCTPKTPYDDKTVTAIRTEQYGGMVDIDVNYVRTFNFQTGTVTDEEIATQDTLDFLVNRHLDRLAENPDLDPIEDFNDWLETKFNNPQTVGTFDEAQADALLKDIKKQGLYTWDDRYYEQAEDAATVVITITFSDGTEKRTQCIAKYPDNYEPVARAFNVHLHIGLLLGIDYTV